MALISATKLFIDFDDDTLTDNASGEQFSQSGSSSFLFNGGWDANRDAYLYLSPAELGISNKFSIGFWLRPKFPGLAESGNSTTTMRISLMDYGSGVVDSSGVTIDNPIIRLTEEAIAKNEHRIAIILGDTTYKGVTESYSSEVDHHFWLVYRNGEITVFIDGISADVTTETGSVPSSIGGSDGIFSINRLAFDGAPDILNNDGFFDEIVVLNEAESDVANIQSIVNYGYRSYGDTSESDLKLSDYSFAMDDPASVRTNGVYDFGSTILAVRSDGKVMQGSPLFWTSRRRFSDTAEADTVDQSDVVVIEGGFLKISEGMVDF